MPARASFVTVVSGVPRSGTSVMMRMLGAGGMELLVDDARPADAFNPGGYFEYAPAKALARDASWVPGAVGRAVKVVHALVPHLPEGVAYRVILMRRDLRDVIRSQRRMLEAGGAPADDLPDDRLAAVFSEQLRELERWAASRPDVDLLSVAYEDLLSDPTPIAQTVAAFLQLPLDPPAMSTMVLHRGRT